MVNVGFPVLPPGQNARVGLLLCGLFDFSVEPRGVSFFDQLALKGLCSWPLINFLKIELLKHAILTSFFISWNFLSLLF